MCAIAGLICLKSGCREQDHVALVSHMCDVQVHRGPDDRGVRALPDVCLGSNRLSIIDLSTGRTHAHVDRERALLDRVQRRNLQLPATARRACLSWIHGLRRTPIPKSCCARSNTGATACFERLVGMFAFAIFDSDTSTLTLARDRFGKKPLYYTHHDGHFLFASEVKALLRICSDPKPNYQRLIEWSLFRNADFGSPDTLDRRPVVSSARALRQGLPGATRHAAVLLLTRFAGPCRHLRALHARVAPNCNGRNRVSHSGGRPGSPRQRRATWHALQRRHRFEPHHGTLCPRLVPCEGVPRFGGWVSGFGRAPIRSAGYRFTRNRVAHLSDDGRRVSP